MTPEVEFVAFVRGVTPGGSDGAVPVEGAVGAAC